MITEYGDTVKAATSRIGSIRPRPQTPHRAGSHRNTEPEPAFAKVPPWVPVLQWFVLGIAILLTALSRTWILLAPLGILAFCAYVYHVSNAYTAAHQNHMPRMLALPPAR